MTNAAFARLVARLVRAETAKLIAKGFGLHEIDMGQLEDWAHDRAADYMVGA